MSEPITTALRGLLCAKPKGDACWDAMDAVDAVHAALEAENAALRQSVEELDNVGGSMHDGGSITDELREWVRDGKGSLLAIADRIDAEHESACKRERGEGIRIAEEAALDEMEHEYVKLPVDADGVPIHIGDVMDSKVDYLFDGRPFYVRALVLCEDGWDVADGRFGNRYEPNSLRHHHAPTVEDVLREFAERVCKSGHQWGLDAKDTIAEYAKRLRLAGEGE